MRFTISALTSVLAGCVSVSDASRIVQTDREKDEEALTNIRHEIAASLLSSHDGERKKRGEEEMVGASVSSSFAKVKETNVYKKLQSRLIPNKLKNSVVPAQKAEKCVLPTTEKKMKNHNLDFGALDEDDRSHRNCPSGDQICVDPTFLIGAQGMDELLYSDASDDSSDETYGICVDRASIPDSYWASLDDGLHYDDEDDEQEHRNLQNSECDNMCSPYGRPVIKKNGYDLHMEIYKCVTGNTECSYKGIPIKCWDTSGVSSLYYAFRYVDYNADLSCWDTSRVTNMKHTFYANYIFNGNIDAWDTSSVTQMDYMFGFATSFNSPIRNWDVSNVLNMSSMFAGAEKFNQKLDDWNPEKTRDTSYMFYKAYKFDQSVKKFGRKLKNCETMSSMFTQAHNFVGKKGVKKWKTENVMDMSYMFYNATSFKGKGIHTWKVQKVESMYEMFYLAKKLETKKLGKWKTDAVTDMAGMFEGAEKFNDKSIAMWNVASVEFFDYMFEDATKFKANLDPWRLTSAVSAANMFNQATKFNACLSTWGDKIVASTFNSTGMFVGSACPDQTDPVPGEGPWCQTPQDSCNEATFATTCADGVDLGTYDQRCIEPCTDISKKVIFNDNPENKINCVKVKKCKDAVPFITESDALFSNYCAKRCGSCFNWGPRAS